MDFEVGGVDTAVHETARVTQAPQTASYHEDQLMQYAVPDLPTAPPETQFSPFQHVLASTRSHAASYNDLPLSAVPEDQPHVAVDKEPLNMGFYGSTTQAFIRSPHVDAIPALVETDFDQDIVMNMDSAQLRKALLRVFFKIQPHSQVIVNEELFMRGRTRGGRNRYYSLFLEDAMAAAATRNSTSSAVRKLGGKYADRAKASIVSELELPLIASLQGFLLLSDFEATRGRARLGWTYSSTSYLVQS